MKIYTKTGDKGTTSLVGGQRVMKNDPRLNAYGTIDELNSFLGLLRAQTPDENISSQILEIQNTLFTVGAILATDKSTQNTNFCAEIDLKKIENLENSIDIIENSLPKLTEFVIYGSDPLSALCHVCRAVARRSEREIITLSQAVDIDNNLLKYINRLSDYLFVLARLYTKNADHEDFLWKK